MAITNQICTFGYGPTYNQILAFGYYSAAVPDYLGVPVAVLMQKRRTEAADPPAVTTTITARRTQADIREAPD